MRSGGRPLVLASLALMLSGCLSVGTVDRRATALNLSVADTQNRAVLLNLARASRAEPIYFTAVNQLGASALTDFKLGLPSFSFGPNQTAAMKVYTFGAAASDALDNQTSTNFQMGVLGSRDFYSGLMAPLSLRDVDLLLHQGFSRELVFLLVIDKIKITPSGDEPTVIYNDPTDARTFPLFEQYIREAMVHGLTTQSYLAPEDSSAAGAKLIPHAELCYERAMATAEARQDFPNRESGCGFKPSVRTAIEGGGSALEVHLHGQTLKLEVTTRSIFGVFYYLGGVMAHHDEATLRLHHYDLPAETTVDAPLLAVLDKPGMGPVAGLGGGLGETCFTAVDYEGRHYCVPQDGADNTKRIFGILAALLALKQSPGDLPITQTVRIAP